MKQFQTARDLSPHKAMATMELAAAYLSTGNVEQSISELRGIIDNSENTKEKLIGYMSLTMGVYPYVGRYDMAESTLQEGIQSILAEDEVDSTALSKMLLEGASLRYWGRGDTSEIKNTLAVLETFPEKAKTKDYWQGIAALNIVLGDTAAAAANLRRSKPIKVVSTLFDVLQDGFTGMCDRGQKKLDEALAGDPDMHFVSEETLSPFRFALAGCQIENNNYDQAIKNLERVVSVNGLTFNSALVIPKSYYRLGQAYEAAGDAEKAVESYRKLLEIWKDADEDLPELTGAKARLAALDAAGAM